jgi:Protein of unknown function (DUF751)
MLENVEAFKMYFQFFQHLTTINTGSIILLATLLEKLFKSPKHKVLIKWCFGSFIMSLVFCLSGMWFVSAIIMTGGEFQRVGAAISWLISIIGFLIGIGSLAIFSIKNLE